MSAPLVERPWDYSITHSGTTVIVALKGRIDATGAAELLHTICPHLAHNPFQKLRVDFGSVCQPDDFSMLVGLELKKLAHNRRATFDALGASEEFIRFLTEWKVSGPSAALPSRSSDILSRFGAATLQLSAEGGALVKFVGSMCLAFLQILRRPHSLRFEDTLVAMQRIGVDALPIVGLISFLLGLIMAFMSAVQLRQFGANIYVASLVSLAMTRELGPIMTAIIVAGRSGSAFAAEIGTMKISDEIDALTTMGFDPVQFLVMPKLVAAVIMVPLLVLFSDLFAIIGGLIVGVGMLELTAGSYVAQTLKTLELFDVFWGVMKAGVFAVLITWIGCFRGFQVRGGAASVGEATTSAVVSGIFLIILTDSVCAVILRYWG